MTEAEARRHNPYFWKLLVVTHKNTRLHGCVAPEKILMLGLYRLAHGNLYGSIEPVFSVGRLTVLEAVRVVVEAPFNLRNDCTKFPMQKHSIV